MEVLHAEGEAIDIRHILNVICKSPRQGSNVLITEEGRKQASTSGSCENILTGTAPIEHAQRTGAPVPVHI